MKTWVEIVAALVVLVGVLAYSFVGCTDEAATISTLQSAGYTEITPGGYAMWGCGEDDTYATKFTARNPAGTMVNGVVCCGGWGKGCTIRF
jgi:hypothetical protein